MYIKCWCLIAKKCWKLIAIFCWKVLAVCIYTNSVEKKYLEVAKLFIQAYLEMGFLYQEGEKVFDVILNELGEQREIEYPERNYVERKIKLNKSQVRSLKQRGSG